MKLNISDQQENADKTIQNHDQTYNIMICVQDVSCDLIDNDNFLKQKLLYIKKIQFASVIEMILLHKLSSSILCSISFDKLQISSKYQHFNSLKQLNKHHSIEMNNLSLLCKHLKSRS